MTASRVHIAPRDLKAAVELMGSTGRPICLPVKGRSMLPTLEEGQRILCEVRPGKVSLGDLLVFEWPQDAGRGPLEPRVGLTVHRLVGRVQSPDGGMMLLTRGDGKGVLDPPVPPGDLVGRVVAIQGADGWRSVRSGPGRLYGLALALHDRFWAGLLEWAGEVDEQLEVGRGVSVRRVVWALDRRLLRIAHALLHRRVHPPLAAPDIAEVDC